MARLREFLTEVPAERFSSPLKVAEIPRLFTTETFCKMAIRQQRTAAAAGLRRRSCGVNSRAAAASLVNDHSSHSPASVEPT